MDSGEEPLVLDVRRREDREKDPRTIGDAQWQDPTAVDDWADDLPSYRPIIVYCVRGGAVSQSVQKALSLAGFEARYLEGGLQEYKGN